MASIDIDIDDILYSMMSYEKQQLADELYEAGYIPKKLERAEGPNDDDWNDAIEKLKGNNWKLSKEDEETILKIANKIV